ncbi:DUF4410 domain-containing protein [Pontiellaceae bacterium B12227]|nr:DUF4410 domain-containing protein [Pontiellaceae bacterium B12227]
MKKMMLLGLGLVGLGVVSGCSTSSGGSSAAPLSESHIYADSIDKSSPIYVKLFSTENTEMKILPDEDTSLAIAASIPHLVTADIVHTLRGKGFSNVMLETSGIAAPENALVLDGRFTLIDSGSQAARIWIGFGTGKSQVCIEGQLADAAGRKICDFRECAGGIGWGSSAPQMETEGHTIGQKVGHFIAGLAE